MNRKRPPICALIVSRNRPEFLTSVSIPSLVHQILRPAVVVVVDDGDPPCRAAVRGAMRTLLAAGIQSRLLVHSRGHGLAKAWNHGLQWIATHWPNSWCAGLDDDDEWLPSHLSSCWSKALSARADIVISGSDIVIDGAVKKGEDVGDISVQSFLRGNPGFRGSTIFARSRTLLAVDGMDPWLPSTNVVHLAT